MSYTRLYTPNQKTFYVMGMFDHGRNFGSEPDTTALDGIATKVYGHSYVGQQTGDMISNDTDHSWSMSEKDVEAWLRNDEDNFILVNGFGEFEHNGQKLFGRVPGGPKQKEGTLFLASWLAEPVLPGWKGDYDTMDHERLGPIPQVMLSHLIKDGHLPYGDYLIRVSW